MAIGFRTLYLYAGIQIGNCLDGLGLVERVVYCVYSPTPVRFLKCISGQPKET
jgi:hypothetical protein